MEDINIQEIWDKVLEILKDKVGKADYNMWLLPLVPHSFENNCFCLLTGNSLANSFINKDKKEILEAFYEVLGQEVLYEVVYDDDLKKQLDKKHQELKKAEDKEYLENMKNRPKSTKYDGLKEMRSGCNLNLKYKFENFVVGANNKFAYATSLAVAKNPGKQYNPLFIYGGSGLGKTHLLQAIGHEIVFHKPKLRVQYVTAETFISDFTSALAHGMDKKVQSKKMNDFHNKYRNVDVLLIDDIQLIEGKSGTENEIFNTFNELHNEGKQIVLTSDRSPDKFEILPDRLKSRFQSGLLADIQVPDIETRMAILKKLAIEKNVNFPFDVISFLASVYNKNIRELECAFNTVTAKASVTGLTLNVDNVKKMIGYRENRKTVTQEGIIDIVASYYNVSVDEMKSPNREAAIAKARSVAVYLMKEMMEESYPSIGKCFNRKHTTIMHSYDKIKLDVATDRRVAQEVQELTEKINA